MVLGLLTVSCKLPSRETWSRVQQEGLLPVVFERRPGSASPSPSGPDSLHAGNPAPGTAAPDGALRVQAVAQPEIARIPFATPVPGLPGYVFSPHVEGRKLIDVRKYIAGVEVRCPYTLLAFQVPDFKPAPPAPAPQTAQSVAEMVSREQPHSLKDPLDGLPGIPAQPSLSLTEPDLPDIPYGSRVPDRPGFVYSPFAGKNQLVDVAGIAPGVEVKCPYSDKLFRVPEPLPEEVGSPVPPAEIPGLPTLPPSPESPAGLPSGEPALPNDPPAPVTPALKDPLPVAAWADKAKLQVQSPYGTPGQLVDVSGRAPGSTMACPFTNKEFVIPAP
jgi:hypothetical protein